MVCLVFCQVFFLFVGVVLGWFVVSSFDGVRDGYYDGLSHAKVRLLFHVVLATKYRRACLCGLEEDVCRVFVECAGVSDFDVLGCGVGDGDHVHLLVRLRKPGVSVGQVVRRLKCYSSRVLWEEHGVVLSRFYRGGRRRLWSAGYFCSTVGVDDEVVSRYVRNQ